MAIRAARYQKRTPRRNMPGAAVALGGALCRVGAGDGTRTHDILLGKQTLCQLSYARPLHEHYRSTRLLLSSRGCERIEERREGGGHPVGTIGPGFSGLRPPTRICDESPLHHGLSRSFVCVYAVLARVSTQHAAKSPPVRFRAAFSIPSSPTS